MKRKNKVIVGITGVIGSGKSTAAEFFCSQGYPLVNADRIGHQVLKDNSIKKKLVAEFGNRILENGEINRKKLGNIVFEDKNKLLNLNLIVHPKIIDKIKKKVNKIDASMVFIDAALLLDWNMDKFCDVVILITADETTLINRLNSYRNYSAEQAKSRMKAQDFSKEKADYIITNNSSKEEFYIKLEKILHQIKLDSRDYDGKY
ncbi:MAG: dephospho-CoA kinase [Candidatus Cloacimonetes bacterium]|nr:dephospho-CoA kinase [Candidatus Cloacimonadota bacterium]MBS3766722.1 dephospho-CoA kinase [Candidatus Cloacimonadota bacterium]